MQFPMSLPDDGLIDIVIQEHVSTTWSSKSDIPLVNIFQTNRGEMLKAIDGAPNGHPFWLDSVCPASISASIICSN